MRGELGVEAGIDEFRVLTSRIREDDGELVPADPTGDVRRTNNLPNTKPHDSKQRVPDGMAETVVDTLEPVDIEQDQRKRTIFTVGDSDLLSQRPLKVPPVEQTGQRVKIVRGEARAHLANPNVVTPAEHVRAAAKLLRWMVGLPCSCR